jgi:hypothetical protein
MGEESPETRATSDAGRNGFASGKEVYARLAREGAPDEITLRGLTPAQEPRMSVAAALSARPVSGPDQTHG